MTTLIIGCGYLGQRLGALLRQRGERVFGTVRSPRRAPPRSPGWASSRSSPTCSGPIRWRALPAAERVFYCVGFDRAAGASMRDRLCRRAAECS